MEDHFDWRTTKNGRVLISRGDRQVSVVAGDQARRLTAGLENALARGDAEAAQHLLARVTGNYKRGNERTGRSRPRPHRS